jgi:hypothetical protein
MNSEPEIVEALGDFNRGAFGCLDDQRRARSARASRDRRTIR